MRVFIGKRTGSNKADTLLPLPPSLPGRWTGFSDSVCTALGEEDFDKWRAERTALLSTTHLQIAYLSGISV